MPEELPVMLDIVTLKQLRKFVNKLAKVVPLDTELDISLSEYTEFKGKPLDVNHTSAFSMLKEDGRVMVHLTKFTKS